ncbi:DUF2171 domain-containing protein [Aurantiacibacter aquimixticola]|uniref:DUF2171 domain-containing protein n=1 Tax=Aurantiacibacter aquimixticola TaxID=1958945 RepID=A0A419RVK9_9SPHN|nr:DUF2171 domain-containing protein [Aurantiacibacter aquimixticola]RJY09830.1 DUF2171 domain-containing protein [Aurantiacibacter aquimixticola]
MFEKSQIREDMIVVDADGERVGIIDLVEEKRFRLKRAECKDRLPHYLPMASVAHVERDIATLEDDVQIPVGVR